MSALLSNPTPGFDDPVHDAQACFRAVLDAMAQPGRVVDIDLELAPPSPLQPASAAVLLSLADFDTPLWLGPGAGNDALAGFLRFHCGCPFTANPGEAAFALVADPLALPPLDAFAQGSDDYPDRSTTLIVQVDRLAADAGWTLRGPGIAGNAHLSAAPLGADLVTQLQANHRRYPRGVDLLLTAHRQLAALPRSTRIGD